MNGRLAFFREFLRHPAQIGSIIPSSKFLERRILAAAGLAEARTVVELGPGTGGTTRALLQAMPRQARLLSVEINRDFYAWISRIGDHRLIPHLGSACDLREIMAHYNMEAPEVVVSGIPFSTMPHSEGIRVLEAVTSLLPANGRFVAYQMRNRVAFLSRPYLGAEKSVLEICNIPPMRIYQWQKKADQDRR